MAFALIYNINFVSMRLFLNVKILEWVSVFSLCKSKIQFLVELEKL